MMLFVHAYLGYTHPLFLQGLGGIEDPYCAQVVMIHLIRMPVIGNLKRPLERREVCSEVREIYVKQITSRNIRVLPRRRLPITLGFHSSGSPKIDRVAVWNAEKHIDAKKQD